MGYHLTILRTVRGKSKPITRGELELALPTLSGWSFGSEPNVLNYEAEATPPLWLHFDESEGELWLKAGTEMCNEEGFQPLLKLAAALSARLRGDEFETYRSYDDSFIHPDDKAEISRLPSPLGKRKSNKVWDYFRIVVLIILFSHLLYRVFSK